MTQPRFRVGLTGGIGAGKSAVARVFAACGAHIIDADILARRAVAPGSPGLQAIAARWPGVIAADGTLERAALGAIVFADEAARAELNAIVHPAVRQLGELDEAAAPPGAVIVHDVPLLFEEGFADRCDFTVVVIAPDATRIARVMTRDGLSDADVRRRMERQIDPDVARNKADFVIENDADMETLEQRAHTVFQQIQERVTAR